MATEHNTEPGLAHAADLQTWQGKLLPYMMAGIAALALLFFVGTFWNYTRLQERLAHQDPDIVVAIEKLRGTAASPAYQDWYMRVVLEERAMRSRHHQNAAVIESRVWTRFMGFITGMVMVMAGCIFILGKLDATFDGSVKAQGNEGVLKTNSPGLVLAVVGSVLIAISLVVSVNIEVTDRPVYIQDPSRGVVPSPEGDAPLPPPAPLDAPEASAPAPASGARPASTPGHAPLRAPASMPPEVAAELCRQAGQPANCTR